jgi:hypothetical protein
MRRAVPLLATALIAAALLAACGSAGEEATDALAAEPAEVVTEAQASVGEAVDAALEEASAEAASRAEEAVEEPAAADNAGAWAAVDAHARTFAGRLDEATQSIATCQTEAAEGADFDACTAASYAAVADAGEILVAGVDEGIAIADGACRGALEAMREAAGVMAEDYRAAIGVTDLTGLETAYERIAADAEVYSLAVVDAAGACAGG